MCSFADSSEDASKGKGKTVGCRCIACWFVKSHGSSQMAIAAEHWRKQQRHPSRARRVRAKRI
jgi:hypothetical protein